MASRVHQEAMAYAKRIAYLSCPTTIRAHCIREFGEGKAPPLDVIRRIRALRQEASKPAPTEPVAEDAKDYAPTRIACKQPVPRPVETRAPAPRATPWPRWYKTPAVNPDQPTKSLMRSVALDFGISVAEMLGEGRWPHLVEARAVAAQVLKERGRTSVQVARELKRKDHTTILHALKTFPKYCSRNPIVQASYERHRPQGVAG